MGQLEEWDRQPGESRQAFDAFRMYRDMDPEARSIVSVAEKCGKNQSLIYRWSSRWKWIDRAAARDADFDRKRREKLDRSRLGAIERQVQIARAMQGKVVEGLQHLESARVTARDLAYWFDVAVKVERTALGEATERVEVDLSIVTPFLEQVVEQVVMPLVKTEEDMAFVQRKLAELARMSA